MFREYAKRIPYAASAYRRLLGRQCTRDDQIRSIEHVAVDGRISLIKNLISETSAFFPYPSAADFNRIQLFILLNGFERHMVKKYWHETYSLEPGDDVIDCGGFVGAFSIAAAQAGANRVFHIEPTPTSRKCALLNFRLRDISNVESHELGLGDTCATLMLNLSTSGADNSLLEPDEGSTGERIPVEIMTIDSFVSDKAIDERKAFFKVEAEGYEVEIIRGMNEFRPQKIVVDVSPERGGVSPADEIRGLLMERGYTSFAQTSRCLFAKREP
jgi:FkbM family methyltransferase